MKNIITLSSTLILFLCLSANVFAQADSSLYYEVNEVYKKMSEGEHAGLTIHVPDADRKLAGDTWKNFMDQYDARTKKGLFSREYRTEKAHIYAVGGVDPVDVYATFENSGDGVDAFIWFRLSKSDFLNSTDYGNAFQEAKRVVNNFGLALRQVVLKKKLDEANKLFEEYKSEMEDLKEENKDLHQTIKESKEAIAKAEKGIEKNLKEQDKMLKTLEEQQKKVEEARLRYNRAID